MAIPKNWEAPKPKEFPPLPDDIYQVFIEDVSLVKGTAYKSNKEVWQLVFRFRVLDDGEFYGRRLWRRVNPVISAGGANKKPANFNLIYEAVYKRTPYQDQLTNITGEVINNFIGRQLRIAVRKTVDDTGKPVNRIDSYLPVKNEFPLPEDWKKPETEEIIEEGADYDLEERIKEEQDIPFDDIPDEEIPVVEPPF